jgi:hypothetical protein
MRWLYLLGMFLVGCAPLQRAFLPHNFEPQPRQAKVILSEYEPCLKSGTSHKKGQAFLTTAGGDIQPAAGNTIVLTPITSFSSEEFNARMSQIALKATEEQAPKPKVATADAHGNFEFSHIAACDYYVETYITKEDTGRDGMPASSVPVGKKARVDPGETTFVILTQ